MGLYYVLCKLCKYANSNDPAKYSSSSQSIKVQQYAHRMNDGDTGYSADRWERALSEQVA